MILVCQELWSFITQALRLRQFYVRDPAKAQMEMVWACLTYNLQYWIALSKLHPTTADT
jgi:hypothetical protein